MIRRPWLRELLIAAGIYLVFYRLLVHLTPSYSAPAYPAGRAVWHAERLLRLPSEAWLQHQLVHGWVARVALSAFYLVAHPFSPWVALAAAWRRDRDLYYRTRRALIAGTVASLAFSLLVPVAPPRLLGVVVDVPAQLHMSEYSTHGVALYAAFPSVHALWAVIVARVVEEVSGSRLAGCVWITVTVAAVILTGNHTWADCAAGAILGYAALRLPPLRFPEGITPGPLRKPLYGDPARPVEAVIE